MGKTVVEKQIQAYGEFQREIRNMSNEQRERYAAQGTPEHDRLLAKNAAVDARDILRAKKIAEYEKSRPGYSTRGLTPDQMKTCQDELFAWEKGKRAFMEKLNQEFPDLRK